MSIQGRNRVMAGGVLAVVLMVVGWAGTTAFAKTIYWNNGQGTWNWNASDTNWSTSTSLTPSTNFAAGDTVWFGSFATGGNGPVGTVTIDAGGVGPAVVNFQRDLARPIPSRVGISRARPLR
jgi:hypothetical protein